MPHWREGGDGEPDLHRGGCFSVGFRVRMLIQGQDSTITSSSYAYLDSDEQRDGKLSSKQDYISDYPDLEDMLYHWHMQVEKSLQGRTDGWLERFKKKHNLIELDNRTYRSCKFAHAKWSTIFVAYQVGLYTLYDAGCLLQYVVVAT